ncbi:MAG: carbohydrate-binding domain-containing protein [Lachnospiraceae bacterium]|nr:carbohydrate-binding domain-containing protein [Lachnospiraceae bacterium]
MKRKEMLALLLALTMVLGGCGASGSATESGSAGTEESADASEAVTATVVDTSDMFTDRDIDWSYDEEDCAHIELDGDSASADTNAVEVSGSTVTITDEGTYILSGTLDDGMIVVDAGDSDKVQLVLDGVDITSATSAAIYVLEADKVFVTTASGSENTLTNGGEYVAIDDNNIDAVIFSKDDLVLNGGGTLTITAAAGHGVVSKDDLKATSGTYVITAESHGLSGKDSVRIADGTFTIVSGKDGIHASNEDDESLGYVYIAGGSFAIESGDDGIHADSAVTIAAGTIDIAQSYEGIEGLSIDITGGDISVVASDDGLNAAGGTDSSGFGGRGGDIFSAEEGAYISIAGGTLHVNASGDGIDSNGALYVSGGETYVSGPTDNANGALDYTCEAVISGGIFIAAGSSGMAQNFGSSSTQGVMMVTVDSASAGSTLTLCDSDGMVLLSWQPDKAYSSVVLSCPEITEGSTYTLTAGSYSAEITMDSLVYGSGTGMGGAGGMGGMGGGRGDGTGTAPEGDSGSAPDGSAGEMPDDSGEEPGGSTEMPGGNGGGMGGGGGRGQGGGR